MSGSKKANGKTKTREETRDEEGKVELDMAKKQKLQYHVVMSNHPSTLDELVNEKLAQGWELQGGVGVTAIPNAYTTEEPEKRIRYTYVQAVTRYVDEGAAALD